MDENTQMPDNEVVDVLSDEAPIELKENPRSEPPKSRKKIRKNTIIKIVVSVIVLALIVVLAVPESRYFSFNAVGLRTRSVFTVLDGETNRPIVGANIILEGNKTKSDQNGKVEVSGLKHGNAELHIKHPGFAELNKEIVLHFGTNNLEKIKMDTAGTRFTLLIKDKFSDQPVANAQINYGESSVSTDDKGKAQLVIEPTEAKDISVGVKADKYTKSAHKISTETSDQQTIQLLPDRQHYFISQRDGRFGVYSMNLEGGNEKLIVKPTGNEESEMRLSVDPSGKILALVSTRAGQRNKEGNLLESLDIVDLKTGKLTTLATSQRIELLDWSKNRLVFISQKPALDEKDKNRTVIRSYEIGSLEANEIAGANYFQDSLVADGLVYYIPFDTTRDRISGVTSVNVDGSNRIDIVTDKEVYKLYRNRYGGLIYEVSGEKSEWFSFDFHSRKSEKLSGRPANLKEQIYQISPDGKKAIFADKRDGQGALLVTGTEADKPFVVAKQSGLQQPLQWLRSDLVVYRVVTDSETADYLLNLNNNKIEKLGDVYHADGIDRYSY